MHGRRVSPFLARPAFQRRFQFPDRGIARTPYRIAWGAGAGLAAVAFDFEPTVSAIEALRDARGWLRATVAALKGIEGIGQHILLDGEIVMRLMLGAIDCSLELFTAVDDWIAQNWTLKERRQRRARRPAFRGGTVTTIASALMDWV
jgi:hypothetical protein